MGQTTYQVILSTDGKHTVIATTDEGPLSEQALTWVRNTYDHLVQNYGLKGEQHQRMTEEVTAGERKQETGEEAPICAVHNVPMVRQQGRHGPFWSCHKFNADGSFCSYKPNRR